MASTSDKITDTRNAARPVSTTVGSTRSIGGTTLSCASLAGWPTASKVHFVTYQIDTNNNPLPNTQMDWYGIVSGSDIGSLTLVDGVSGNDIGNSVGDIVEMLPTAGWGQDLADALMAEHDRDGTHTAITAASINLTGAATTDTINEKTAAAGVTVDGLLIKDGYPKAVAKDQLSTDSNPYKWRAYRNAAANTGNAAYAVLACDTESFDTNSNLASGVYTAPVTGYYWVSAEANAASGGSNRDFQIAIFVNGAIHTAGTLIKGLASTNNAVTVSGLIALTAGDTMDARVYGEVTLALNVASSSANYFTGFLVSRT